MKNRNCIVLRLHQSRHDLEGIRASSGAPRFKDVSRLQALGLGAGPERIASCGSVWRLHSLLPVAAPAAAAVVALLRRWCRRLGRRAARCTPVASVLLRGCAAVPVLLLCNRLPVHNARLLAIMRWWGWRRAVLLWWGGRSIGRGLLCLPIHMLR